MRWTLTRSRRGDVIVRMRWIMAMIASEPLIAHDAKSKRLQVDSGLGVT